MKISASLLNGVSSAIPSYDPYNRNRAASIDLLLQSVSEVLFTLDPETKNIRFCNDAWKKVRLYHHHIFDKIIGIIIR